MIALEWRDIDLNKRQLCVQRSEWKVQVTAPKGGRPRYVPLTTRLAAALREFRHLRSRRELCRADGSSLSAHKDLITTQRYMHLSPAALDSAIRLLDSPGVLHSRGDVLETANG